MAGNQLGKTIAGGAEWAMHATGRYPNNWQGATFERPPILWASGVTGESTRDNPQRILVGEAAKREHWGTGFIPKDRLLHCQAAMGVPNLLDHVVVRWGGGGDVQAGESVISFKSYEKGREKWQGPTVDGVWFDEEPPMDIHAEGLTRTNNGQRGQFTIMTFTPLLGMSEVVREYLMGGNERRHVTTMTIHDADHYSAEEKAAIIASYPAHERDARAKGIPQLGSGRIFPVAENGIAVEPFPIPRHWTQIIGLDFGWDHPTAAVRLAYDRDSDTVYVTAVHRLKEATPIIHASVLQSWGKWIPVSWPHDGYQHDKGSGTALKDIYASHGLRMLPNRSQFPDGSNGVEAGLMLMLQRMQAGKFKVFSHLAEWFDEFRLYHRKDGKVVKEHDDLMSATRYALMDLRFAVPEFNHQMAEMQAFVPHIGAIQQNVPVTGYY